MAWKPPPDGAGFLVMEDDETVDLTETLQEAEFTQAPELPRTISDEELVELGYQALQAWAGDPTIRQATLIGRLIALYEQTGRRLLGSYALGQDDVDDRYYDDEAVARPALTVIKGDREG